MTEGTRAPTVLDLFRLDGRVAIVTGETLKPAFNRSACPPLSNSRIWEYPRKFSVL